MSKSRFFISCEEANHNCDKNQYREASFFDKIRLLMHLAFCKACRKYSKKNSKLTDIINKDRVECLDENEKRSLKKAFHEELAKRS